MSTKTQKRQTIENKESGDRKRDKGLKRNNQSESFGEEYVTTPIQRGKNDSCWAGVFSGRF